MNPRVRGLADWLLIAGFCAFLFFYGLGSFGLIGADEPRYAQIAREMLARHDWITPTLGGTPWLEKPVLYYWEAMVSYRILGVSDWAARAPSAVDAMLLVFAVYFFLRRFRRGMELDGALITASAAGIIGFARAASMDMPLAATFGMAMLAWYGWYESRQRSYLAGFYALLALGTLAKGPVAPFLAFVIVGIFAVARRDWAVLRRTVWVPGILLFFLIALPWYVAVEIRNPEFFRVFILEHNLARFGTNLYHHKEPFWYYLPVMLLGLLPWTVLVLAALWEALRAWRTEKVEMLRGESALEAFLVIWLVVPLIFFSVSQSKLPGYIVPALPAGTLILSEYVRRYTESARRPGWVWIGLHAITAASLIVPSLLIVRLVQQRHLAWDRGTEVSCFLAGILAIGIVITLLRSSGLRLLRFVTLIPVLLSMVALLRIGAPALDDALSARPLFEEISHLEDVNALPPLATLNVPRETEYGLAFYRGQVITPYTYGQIPPETHILVAPQPQRQLVARVLRGRRVSYLGTFWPQKMDYYWVAKEGSY
ncbi:MAG TPA: glycosyltransferase family 39 protein [Terriglobales bacterium]|nr:glycosyltransferase family 39 protein [Terriglobales bacterium]